MSAKLILMALICLAAPGQVSTPSFEVASIKPATPLGPLGMRANRSGGPGTPDPGMYICENCPIFWVLSEAYDLQSWEYAGPDWIHGARFDFTAKVPAGATKDTLRIMLQNLLAERFKLAVHREKKEMQVYEMTVAKNGPKFRESPPKDAPKDIGAPGQLQRDREDFQSSRAECRWPSCRITRGCAPTINRWRGWFECWRGSCRVRSSTPPD